MLRCDHVRIPMLDWHRTNKNAEMVSGITKSIKLKIITRMLGILNRKYGGIKLLKNI